MSLPKSIASLPKNNNCSVLMESKANQHTDCHVNFKLFLTSLTLSANFLIRNSQKSSMCCRILESRQVKFLAIQFLIRNFRASNHTADNVCCFPKQKAPKISFSIFQKSIFIFLKMLSFLSLHLHLFLHFSLHGRSSSLR